MIYTPSVVINGLYFDKKRSLANGLGATAGAVGALIGPMLCVKLIELYTWQGTMISLAGIYLQSVAAGALFREIPQSSKDALAERRGEGGRLMMPLTDTKKFVLHCLNYLLNSFSVNVLVTFGVLYGVRQGLSLSQAALMITVLNICNVVLQFVVSSLADRSWFFRRIVFVVATIILGVTYFLFLLAREPWSFTICCVLYGCAYGARASLETTMLVDLFGIQNLPMVQAFYHFSYGLGGLVGPLAAGECSRTIWLARCVLS
ncbi:PREDICTED: monocarboxylate transporter 4-like [Priapulus caudatus]|uniref:Monocarboxylate transporter 4-like n=1 Tax=Priapulus caudatus TaxID=37621 RepID=A0ABM1F149_PRICU|nr:PREDICTED: monocarboxylate transporter 4-like [Priapulus caudatus]